MNMSAPNRERSGSQFRLGEHYPQRAGPRGGGDDPSAASPECDCR